MVARSHFGSTLQRLRKDAGLRQADLADVVGMARSTVANVEAGREPPTPRLWVGLTERFPAWADELVRAADRDRLGEDVDDDLDRGLGGPFVIESLGYVYVFEHARSPSEILEVRRVRATQDGADRFRLRMRYTGAPGFRAEERVLWGGHLVDRESRDEQDRTTYLRTVVFDRRLRRGDRHEFATRTLVERDPEPGTSIEFNLTIPVQQAGIHLDFQGPERPAAVWSYGPVTVPAGEPDTPDPRRPVPIPDGHGSAYFARPLIGPVYGVAWTWSERD